MFSMQSCLDVMSKRASGRAIRFRFEKLVYSSRMSSSGMVRRVALVRTDVSEELSTFAVCVGC
jgi:hypothetical protein